ncbi:MAG: hypothetical protein GX786_09195, partial [Clostridiales bacterium]|nr:hypothetical protein [Clostridiales bacterium]
MAGWDLQEVARKRYEEVYRKEINRQKEQRMQESRYGAVSKTHKPNRTSLYESPQGREDQG